MHQEQTRRLGSERFEVRTGTVLVIDQFMIGNRQFLERVDAAAGNPTEIARVVRDYGGVSLALPNGTYRVHRFPERSFLFVVGEGQDAASEEEIESLIEDTWSTRSVRTASGRVFVDTRCLVFMDVNLLIDGELRRKYMQLRREERDKEARDLLRESGAAVRYGFNHRGDELGVFALPEYHALALWPDVIESIEEAEEELAGAS